MTDLDHIRLRLQWSQDHEFPLRIHYSGLKLTASEGVLSPLEFTGWRWYTENFPPFAGKRILEVGCGFGLPGLYLAKCGALSLVACDINPKAVANTLENAERNDIRNVEVIESDIFNNIPSESKFDFIFWNCPSEFAPKDYQYRDDLEPGAIDPGYGLLRRFLSEGPEFLSASGSILLGFPRGLRDDLLWEIITANDLICELIRSGTHSYSSYKYRMFSIRRSS
ncbi:MULTISPECIES: methyltransferase [Mesorhizobium]|uniref:methyltransferase n=1 Tax=Mesorhizobium TaxID=68287 RepID=UPI0003CEB07A|nr:MULTISPECIES: methyltransferase [Mesorhizobium]ESY65904.1 hypothetical protein X742_20380 [Mesorhizobium sp. LNHC232B00]WJI38328.1 methyltransferase [Mesorhizobium opportunistum]